MIISDDRRRIRDVWAVNFAQEMENIRKIIKDYNYVAMDTEFPGTIAKPQGAFKSPSDYTYQGIRVNVDLLKIIQLGMTFSNEKGETPPDVCTWQFNFRFNVDIDMSAQDSIELLKKSGINFEKHATHGIDPDDFGELFISSGLVLLDNIKWISFHSSYDFGYLLKVLSGGLMPQSEKEFYENLKIYFPNIYDIKYLAKSCKSLGAGLQEIADDLQITRVGIQHQAGSDSLITLMVFFKLRQTFFEGLIDDQKFLGIIYGIGPGAVGFVPNYAAGSLVGAPLPPSNNMLPDGTMY